MKILIICNDYGYFLAHRAALAEHLCARGWNVVVACGGVNLQAQNAKDHDFQLHALALDRWKINPLTDLKTAWEIREIAKHFQPDIIHTVTVKPALITGLLAIGRQISGAKFVATFAGLGRLFATSDDRKLRIQGAITKAVLRRIARRTNMHATFENSEDADIFGKTTGLDRARLHVTNGAGVDLQQFSPADRKGPLKVLFAARLLKEKGLDWYLHAAQELSVRSDVVFQIAGPVLENDPDSISRAELTAAGKAGTVRYLGNVAAQDMPDLLRQADILCLPTRYNEGFPRIVIEAMAAGCFVITSNHASLQPIIENGQNGFRVETTDYSDFVSALRAALNSPEATRNTGVRASQTIRQAGVGIDEVNAQFERIYEAALATKH